MKIMIPVSTRYLNKKKNRKTKRRQGLKKRLSTNIFAFGYMILNIHVHNYKAEKV